jgi:hypothetical protein
MEGPINRHVAKTYFMQLVDVFEKLSLADGWDTIDAHATLDTIAHSGLRWVCA